MVAQKKYLSAQASLRGSPAAAATAGGVAAAKAGRAAKGPRALGRALAPEEAAGTGGDGWLLGHSHSFGRVAKAAEMVAASVSATASLAAESVGYCITLVCLTVTPCATRALQRR